MNNKQKSKYLKCVVDISNDFLNQNKDSSEYKYLLTRIQENNLGKFSFGLFPREYSSIIRFVDEFGKCIKEDPIEILKDIGVIYITEKYNKVVPVFKHHRLLIPFYDVYGNVISIVGRTILNEEERKKEDISKYKYLTFQKRRHIYGLNFSWKNIVDKDFVVVVEGQFDFISGFVNNIDNIVAIGGSKFTFEQIALLKRFSNNFYVLLDNDDAGIKGIESIKKNASKLNIKVNQLALPPEFKDLDEYLKNQKIDDIKNLVVT